MKALVLSGGAGTRLRPTTHAAAEQPVPVADKAVPFHGLECLADAGITQVGTIVGDTAGRNRLGDDDFVMHRGDNADVGGVTDLVDEFRGSSRPDAQIPLTQVPDPRAVGVAGLGPHGQVAGPEEKPVSHAFQDLAAAEGARVTDSRLVGPAVTGPGTEALGDRSKVWVRS